MQDYTENILELIRLTSTDLPYKVENRLRKAFENEESGTPAKTALETILKNVEIARQNSTPICQDTGTPTFFVHAKSSIDSNEMTRQIRQAVKLATVKNYLRPNAVNAITGRNSGDNLGDEYFPLIHFQLTEIEELTIDLILKGGGCENVSAQYSLPNNDLRAGRDLDGVRRAALDAVFQAQGEGCAPGFLGIAIGGDRETSYSASKEVILRDLEDRNPDAELDQLEKRITDEANELGIGPMGFGGKSTVLAARIKSIYRVPASYFVTVSYMCWAYRRRKMIIHKDRVEYQ